MIIHYPHCNTWKHPLAECTCHVSTYTSSGTKLSKSDSTIPDRGKLAARLEVERTTSDKLAARAIKAEKELADCREKNAHFCSANLELLRKLDAADAENARLREALREWVEYVETVRCGDCYHSTLYDQARAALAAKGEE